MGLVRRAMQQFERATILEAVLAGGHHAAEVRLNLGGAHVLMPILGSRRSSPATPTLLSANCKRWSHGTAVSRPDGVVEAISNL